MRSSRDYITLLIILDVSVFTCWFIVLFFIASVILFSCLSSSIKGFLVLWFHGNVLGGRRPRFLTNWEENAEGMLPDGHLIFRETMFRWHRFLDFLKGELHRAGISMAGFWTKYQPGENWEFQLDIQIWLPLFIQQLFIELGSILVAILILFYFLKKKKNMAHVLLFIMSFLRISLLSS